MAGWQCTAQTTNDTTAASPRIEFLVQAGVFQPQGTVLQERYLTRSYFNWTMGIRTGADNWRCQPWLLLGSYQVESDSLPGGPSKARNTPLSGGFTSFLPLSKNDFLGLNVGLSLNMLREESTDLSAERLGMTFGLEHQRRVTSGFAYRFVLGYEYVSAGPDEPVRDWSGLFLSFGIGLNTAGSSPATLPDGS